MKLSEIQSQLQDQIISESPTPDLLLGALLDGPSLSAEEGLAVYRDMYEARVYSSLADDYPVIHSMLGNEDFAFLVRHYIQAFPSRSFTLEHLGNHFPDFLETREFPASRMPYLPELAWLEHAVNQAFHAPEFAVLQAQDFDLACFDDYLDHRLSLSPSVSLLEMQYNVNRIYSLHESGIEFTLADIVQQSSFLMVLKRHDEIWRYELNPISYLFLKSIQDGKTLGESIDKVLLENPDPFEIEQLFEAFSQWLEDGAFKAL
jgi:hypothetical protein